MGGSLVIRRYDESDDLVADVVANGEVRSRVYVPDGNCVILGIGSDPDRELIIENCLADGIPIYRRDGGGCAVVLDPGQIVVVAVFPRLEIAKTRAQFARLSDWVTEGLESAGVPGVTRKGTSDLVLGDRKVGGGSVRWTKDYFLYGTTLLVDPNVDLMERCLKHPPREPDYRRGRNHRDFMGRLAEAMPGLTAPELKRKLRLNLHSNSLPL